MSGGEAQLHSHTAPLLGRAQLLQAASGMAGRAGRGQQARGGVCCHQEQLDPGETAQCLDSAPPPASPQQHRPLSAPVTSVSISQLEDTPAEAAKCGQGKFTSENAAVSHPALFKTAAAIALARLPATRAHSTPAESVRSSRQGADPTASLVAPGLNQRGWCPRLMLQG